MEHLPDPPRYAKPDVEGDPPILDDLEARNPPPPGQSDPFRELFEWLDETMGSESYGAPRVFDLYTLLAVTLAFAVIFAFLRLIEPALDTNIANVAIAIGIFSTLTAIAQLALWGGKKPRIASVVSGPPIWMLLWLSVLAANPRALMDPSNWIGMLCSSVLGIPAGYLGGALVAGVFLLADKFRQRFMSDPSDESDAQNDDAIWGDIDRSRKNSKDES